MKKILVIMFVLILIFSLSACGGKNEEPAPSLSNDNNSTDDEADTNKSKDIDDDQDQKAYAQAYIDKINEYENEEEYLEEEDLEYDLIYLDEDDIPELVAGMTGYYVSVYTYFSGELYTLMDGWPYGAMGNAGYEFIPKKNVVRNYNSDLAGAIVYESYYQIDENHELQPYYKEELSIWMFKDINENYMMDEGEYNDTDLYYYFGEEEITRDEYNSYLIEGDYEFIYGKESASAIISQLESM